MQQEESKIVKYLHSSPQMKLFMRRLEITSQKEIAFHVKRLNS